MRQLREALARVTGMFTRQGVDEDLREELESHIEMETAEYIRRGMDPIEARRRAMIATGGVAAAAEAVRDQRGLPWVESVAADARYALRALRHSPAFTIVVVVTLALGIGANTAIFSVLRGVLLKPLPNRDGASLVYLRHSADGPTGSSLAFSVPEVADLRAGVKSLAGMAEFSPWTLTMQNDDGAVRLRAGLVTGNYFEIMGLAPVAGRLTSPADDGPGVPAVMVLSHDYWMKRFGGDPGVVGKQLRIDNAPVTVIGVLQPAPFFPAQVDALLNMVVSPHHLSATMVQGRTHRMTEIVARVAPGADVRQVKTEIAALETRIHREYPEAYEAAAHHRISVLPYKDVLGERAKTTLWLLMAAATFVLIIAAANVANLTLMRGVRREHELVVRTALGAGMARLRRLLLVENLVLTLLGAAFGIALAFGGVKLLIAFAERYSPRANEITVDFVTLGFALGLSVALAILLSLVASLPREGRLATLIAAGVNRMSGGLKKQRLQRALVVLQVAVSVVLLAGAGLLTRTMLQLADVDTGLRAENVLTMQVGLLTPTQLLTDPRAEGEARTRYHRMRDEVAALPGVTDVGLGSPLPLRSSDVRFDIKAEGKALAVGEVTPNAEFRTASPEFFRAAGIPIMKGRAFESTDLPGANLVVIVNQVLVDKLFPDEDPIGKRVAWTGDVLRFTPISSEWRTIVGVVANTKDGGLDAAPRAVAYMPFDQTFAMSGGLVVRADSNATALSAAGTRIVRRIAPKALIENVMTITQYKERSVAPRRLNAVLVSAFGGLAVLIAAVGIAGVLAFSVSARTNEIGIRMSLGADRGDVQRMILREGGTLVALGLALGVGGAYFTGGVMQGMLFGVAPHDPVTFSVVAATMALIGVVACWIPAMRAARIDPAVTMRSA